MPISDQQREQRRAFGDRVRDLRTAAGLSQEAFANVAEIDRTYISGIERGMRNVSLDNIHKLSRALGVSPRELF